ncbi:U6 snRNA-associated Sm-like protein LSm7 [Linderina pennispora]|uniref:U6 snRNA-associated Sm-like protein LSm7 n=1 Tax=Linderina pennispora TaxID=61395 RepID=A0A1Y1W1P9_9FUNG|nr:U6 snRNA-associated Sm-like protein LSm7 [Linderina pennispora]KAJ1951874.1 U6 snRNP-associated protein Lsm7 [Linderina pennispora]ORX67166.1 U6 snRNA-associated Sm-like protein LSm7 [Linderina pennispora]
MRDGTRYYNRGGGNQRGGGHFNSNSGSGNYRSNNHGHHDEREQKEKRKRDAIFDLNRYSDKRIRVKFQGGREVTGVLKGFDQLMNIVLDDAVETLRAHDNGEAAQAETTRKVGLVVLRGPSIILISPTDGSEEIANPFVQVE